MSDDDDLLPINSLQHLLFCPRHCALVHDKKLWAEDELTIQRKHLHEKADGDRDVNRQPDQRLRLVAGFA